MSEQNGQHRASLITSPASRELVWAASPDERYPVPTPGRFSGETLDASDLESIAGKLIGKRQTALKHLASVDIDYLWKRKGGTRAGMPILGACVRVSGIWAAFTDATWVVWLAADNCAAFTNWLIQCNLIHQLLHAGEGEGGEPTVIGHDFEGFAKELEWCGCWTEGLTVAGRAIGQLQLPMQVGLPMLSNGALPEGDEAADDELAALDAELVALGDLKTTTPIESITPAELPLFAEVTK